MPDAKIIRFGIPTNYPELHSEEVQEQYARDISILSDEIENGIARGLDHTVLIEADDIVYALEQIKQRWIKEVDNG